MNNIISLRIFSPSKITPFLFLPILFSSFAFLSFDFFLFIISLSKNPRNPSRETWVNEGASPRNSYSVKREKKKDNEKRNHILSTFCLNNATETGTKMRGRTFYFRSTWTVINKSYFMTGLNRNSLFPTIRCTVRLFYQWGDQIFSIWIYYTS